MTENEFYISTSEKRRSVRAFVRVILCCSESICVKAQASARVKGVRVACFTVNDKTAIWVVTRSMRFFP